MLKTPEKWVWEAVFHLQHLCQGYQLIHPFDELALGNGPFLKMIFVPIRDFFSPMQFQFIESYRPTDLKRSSLWKKVFTPLKFNMEPKNDGFPIYPNHMILERQSIFQIVFDETGHLQ